MPCLRRGARLGGIFGEVVRTALLAKRDHLAVRHHGKLVTEHRLEQLCERRLLEQQLGQVVAAVPAIEAATVALYNLCALHGHSRQPMQVRRQPAALGLVTADDRSEQRREAGVRLVSDAAERCWCEGRVKPANAVLREERGAGARARRPQLLHAAFGRLPGAPCWPELNQMLFCQTATGPLRGVGFGCSYKTQRSLRAVLAGVG